MANSKSTPATKRIRRGDLDTLGRAMDDVKEYRSDDVTKTEAIRILLPRIHGMQRRGYTVPAIAAFLSERGFPITATALRVHLKQGSRAATETRKGRKGRRDPTAASSVGMQSLREPSRRRGRDPERPGADEPTARPDAAREVAGAIAPRNQDTRSAQAGAPNPDRPIGAPEDASGIAPPAETDRAAPGSGGVSPPDGDRQRRSSGGASRAEPDRPEDVVTGVPPPAEKRWAFVPRKDSEVL